MLSKIKSEGVGMKKATTKNINRTLQYAVPKLMRIDGEYYMVVHVNTSVHKSDIGNKVLTDTYPNADFSASYSIDDRSNSTLFSLRSTNKHINCAYIAKKFGGGGHRNASGLKVHSVTSTIPGEIINNGQLYSKLKRVYFGEVTINEQVFNVVYCNLGTLRSKVGKYLLRDKYTIKEKDIDHTVQVCRSIDMNREGDDYLPSRVNLSAIWSYDGFKNETSFSVVFDKKVTENDKEIVRKFFNGEFYGSTLIVTQDGLCDKLQ